MAGPSLSSSSHSTVNAHTGNYSHNDVDANPASSFMPFSSSTLTFYVNAARVQLENPAPELTLLSYLRSVGLTGTKLGCAEGGCGACTVLVSFYDNEARAAKHTSINACLAPLCSLDGKHVITVEGIGTYDNPHPVQERIALMFGSQCGFCTPGIVMALYALLRNNPHPTEREIEECFDGNLCRCTGYRPILDAAKTFASDKRNAGCCGGTACGRMWPGDDEFDRPATGCGEADCCQTRTGGCCAKQESHAFPKLEFKKYQPSQEIIFPPALINYAQNTKPTLEFTSRRCKWIRPVSIEQLLEVKRRNPEAKLVAGNTEVGIELKFRRLNYPVLVYVSDIPELLGCRKDDQGVYFGANMTLENVGLACKQLMESVNPSRAQPLAAMTAALRYFAGNQIRNVATLAGNIATASPISDMNPVLVACRARLLVISASTGESRSIPADEFFIGYRKTAMRKDEILVNVYVPFSKLHEHICHFKQARRRDDDIAIVTCALRVLLEPNTLEVGEAALVYGGMGPATIRAAAAERALLGGRWGEAHTLEAVQQALTNVDFSLPRSVPGGMAEYRRTLAISFFFKFWCEVGMRCNVTALVNENLGADPIERKVSFARQDFEQVHLQESNRSLGKVIPHVAALKQTCGQAQYTDDIPKAVGELYVGLVMSTKPHAKIISIDVSAALKVPGVHHYVCAKDVPGDNVWSIPRDEEVFATTIVHYHGQIIGVILADDQLTAQEAARLVKIEYEDLPVLLSIEDAIKEERFLPPKRQIRQGDLDVGFTEAELLLSGETRVGGQEHFYLETQASLVIPSTEDGGVEIIASTQNPTETQRVVARVLGVPAHLVCCRVRRLGGGFGGKESRSVPISAVCAVAARRAGRPVRIMLDRDEDMLVSGQRHPFLGKWKVGFMNDGRIHALDLSLFANAGWSADLSLPVMERAITHADNCYNIPNFRVSGKVCMTNTVSNTAFRGFGGPQAMIIAETIICEVADRLGMSAEVVREKNLYNECDRTHFGMQLGDWHVPAIMNQLHRDVDVEARKKIIAEFNARNRWRKRGYALIPTKFGISFTHTTYNQAGALVHIYADGSVLLAHGGTEMGQGLHTKMIQVAAETLHIPVESVHIAETSTFTVANTSPTAASASSDLNGMAVKAACDVLNDRLQEYRTRKPNASMKEIAADAHRDRVNLTANGFYKTPNIGFDWESNTGNPYAYFTQGGAYTEVEIDVLTGDFTILRTDIVMDVGRSLNMGIDVGQVEGAFVQGMGLTTLEETLAFPNGKIQTLGPGAYKIPGFRDIPQEFNISLLKGAKYPSLKTIGSSKGVGEPPLFLGSTVFFAIRDAVKAARAEAGLVVSGENFVPLRMDSPATGERIRLACQDAFVKRSAVTAAQHEKNWVITL